jgi:sec-independent protein translocase protein TatB
MFDIAWSEMVLIGAVALVVIGPKDLPKALRTVGQTVGRIRRMAAEFQGQFNEAMREAELADLKKQVDDIGGSVSNALNSDFKPIDTIKDVEAAKSEAAKSETAKPEAAKPDEAALKEAEASIASLTPPEPPPVEIASAAQKPADKPKRARKAAAPPADPAVEKPASKRKPKAEAAPAEAAKPVRRRKVAKGEENSA